jgi:aconitate hydratase
MFATSYASVFEGDDTWKSLEIPTGNLYDWDDASTYVRKPPYFDGMSREPGEVSDIAGARVLCFVADSITTDHISPAGSIAADSPAGRYLQEHDIAPTDFNSYGSRRGNHEVMMRGTFANVRLKNKLADGKEGNWSKYLPTGEILSVFDTAMKYQADGTPLIVIAGKEYGTGSSRDWAAKGPMLQGIKAVIAESYERIHRSNLIGMGILPLQFKDGHCADSLGLTGKETFAISGISASAKEVTVTATVDGGEPTTFPVKVRIDTAQEFQYYRHGGILQYVLRQLLNG